MSATPHDADKPAPEIFEITEADLHRVLGEAISFWCDEEEVTPLTREHLTEEIVRRLREFGRASCSG